MKKPFDFSVGSWIRAHEGLQLLSLAVLLELALESLHRHGVFGGFVFFANNPLSFAWGVAVILDTLSLSLLCLRRAFARRLTAILWLAMGVVDCVMLFSRTTPLAFIDFQLLPSVWTVLPAYLTPWQMVLAGVAVLGALALVVREYFRCPHLPRRVREGICLILFCLLFLTGGRLMGLRTGAFGENFPNMPDAYNDYGFTYCFSTSFFSQGIDKPEDYSEETIEELLEAIHADSAEPTPRREPNIIFVQLESVMDVGRIAGITVNRDPTPTLNSLRETCSTGLLTVPSIGAGTANTEFEVITGMSRLYFGTGEYPYKTVLQNTPCESLCYNLRELGYTSHAIHNHYGSFYDRNGVFANLGFDTFTSVEYMQDVERTPRGWATDACLTRSILDALDSTHGRDFVYAISVQGHGQYTAEAGEFGELDFRVTSGMDDPDENYSFSYYLSLIAGTDAFVADLLASLEQRAEPCVVVLYGDHLPTFELEEDDLNRGGLLDSEYFIWSNYALPKVDKNLYSYQLGAEVMERLGMENGILTKLHQRFDTNSHYLEALELLEYDMLYGEREAYKGAVPEPTDLQMGLHPVAVHYAVATADGLLVLGENFTEWSHLCVDGKDVETTFVNSHILLAPELAPEETCVLTVEQAGKDRLVLSVSNEYVYEWPPESPVQPLPEIPLLPED